MSKLDEHSKKFTRNEVFRNVDAYMTAYYPDGEPVVNIEDLSGLYEQVWDEWNKISGGVFPSLMSEVGASIEDYAHLPRDIRSRR